MLTNHCAFIGKTDKVCRNAPEYTMIYDYGNDFRDYGHECRTHARITMTAPASLGNARLVRVYAGVREVTA